MNTTLELVMLEDGVRSCHAVTTLSDIRWWAINLGSSSTQYTQSWQFLCRPVSHMSPVPVLSQSVCSAEVCHILGLWHFPHRQEDIKRSPLALQRDSLSGMNQLALMLLWWGEKSLWCFTKHQVRDGKHETFFLLLLSIPQRCWILRLLIYFP